MLQAYNGSDRLGASVVGADVRGGEGAAVGRVLLGAGVGLEVVGAAVGPEVAGAPVSPHVGINVGAELAGSGVGTRVAGAELTGAQVDSTVFGADVGHIVGFTKSAMMAAHLSGHLPFCEVLSEQT